MLYGRISVLCEKNFDRLEAASRYEQCAELDIRWKDKNRRKVEA